MKAEKWQLVSRVELLKHPRMHLVEDTVTLPDGKKAEYLRQAPAKTHSVAVLAINDKGELLLQKEYSYPPDEVMWQLPGGGTIGGETVEESANRELAEESGYNARTCKSLGFLYTNNRRSDEKQYIVICTNLYAKEADADPEEFIETHWVPLAEVKTMMTTGEMHNMNLLAALGLYFANN